MNWTADAGITADQFWVTFDSTVDFDLETGAITSSNTWHQASAIAFDSGKNAGPGNGGSCLGDSGSPRFLHGTNTAVAVQYGGDAICRADNTASRLDIPAARAFYGGYLPMP